MRKCRPHWCVLGAGLPIVVAIVSASSPALAQSDAGLGTVYYQVLYSDQRVSDLPRVPQTNKGIRSVLRIAAVPTADPGARAGEILSTKRRDSRHTGADRTCRTPLAWNGQAWVGSAADRTRQLAEVIGTTSIRRPGRTPRPDRAHPLFRSLRELQNRRAFWRLAAVDVQADMFAHAGTPPAGRRRWDLAGVRAAERRIDRAIDQHKKALAKLAREGKLPGDAKLSDSRQAEPLRPTGKVLPLKPGPKWTAAAGIVAAMDDVHVLPHRLGVWAARPQRGRRTYHVAMAHAEAGTFGAFYYVAYADSTGDGLPDTPLARSALAASGKPGQWTSWRFTTEAERVFIGHAWPNADNAVYCRRATGANWRMLSRDLYVAPLFGALPRRVAGPYVGNCRVYSVPAPARPATQPATRPATP